MPYSAISNAEIDPDSPVTTGLMTKMRDNPEAIALGENGATRVRHAAFFSRITNAWTYNLTFAASASESLTTHTASVSFNDSSAGQKYLVNCHASGCGNAELRINGATFFTAATPIFFAEALNPPSGTSNIEFRFPRLWDNGNSVYQAASVSIQIIHLAA